MVTTLQPGGLTKAQDNLKAQSFEPYAPRFFGDFGKPEFLFPGYLLVKFQAEWGPIRSTRGIANVLMEGLRPGLIKDEEVDRWKDAEAPDGLIRLPRVLTQPRFRNGQRLRLVNGSLAGNRGSTVIYQNQEPQERCAVLMRLLGKQLSVVVREEDLVAL
jgi:transcription antitermination factor NusG